MSDARLVVASDAIAEDQELMMPHGGAIDLDEVLAGPLPPGGETVLSRWSAAGEHVYVGTPINTGPGLVTHLRAQPRGNTSGTVLTTRLQLKGSPEAIVTANTAGLSTLLRRIESAYPHFAVIDSTSFDIPGWRQVDYYRLCTEIIQRFAAVAVFAPGWELSRGCHVELVAALTRGLPVLDAHLRPLTAVTVCEAMAAATHEFESVGIDTSLTRLCIAALARIDLPTMSAHA